MKTPAFVPAFVLSLPLLLHSSVVVAQGKPDAQPPASILVKGGRLLDVKKGAYLENAAIWIEGDRVKEVGRATEVESHAPKGAKVIDLGGVTILPGLIDCHTHIMSRMPDTDEGYIVSLATKSQAFRALEGAYDARITLRAGFTTIRDVENEGSDYADVALRDAISQGLAEGPRMQVATRAIAAVGQYNPFGVSPDLTNFPTGAQMVSGVEEARRAAREQIGHGADLIKVYADWRNPTLTVDEIRVIVEEAHRQKLKVAAHATTPEGIKNAITAGGPGKSRDDEGQRNVSGSDGGRDRRYFRKHQKRSHDPRTARQKRSAFAGHSAIGAAGHEPGRKDRVRLRRGHSRAAGAECG
jgi:predicted amidohydrolase YtcJ